MFTQEPNLKYIFILVLSLNQVPSLLNSVLLANSKLPQTALFSCPTSTFSS